MERLEKPIHGTTLVHAYACAHDHYWIVLITSVYHSTAFTVIFQDSAQR